MKIPTEPIGNIPRPFELIKAIAETGDSPTQSLIPFTKTRSGTRFRSSKPQVRQLSVMANSASITISGRIPYTDCQTPRRMVSKSHFRQGTCVEKASLAGSIFWVLLEALRIGFSWRHGNDYRFRSSASEIRAASLRRSDRPAQLHSFEIEHHHGPIGNRVDKPHGNGVLFWFEVDDFDAVMQRANDMRAEIMRSALAILPMAKVAPTTGGVGWAPRTAIPALMETADGAWRPHPDLFTWRELSSLQRLPQGSLTT